MAMVLPGASACLRPNLLLLPSTSTTTRAFHSDCCFPSTIATKSRRSLVLSPLVMRDKICGDVDKADSEEEEEELVLGEASETLLYSFTPLPLMFLAALPGGTIS